MWWTWEFEGKSISVFKDVSSEDPRLLQGRLMKYTLLKALANYLISLGSLLKNHKQMWTTEFRLALSALINATHFLSSSWLFPTSLSYDHSLSCLHTHLSANQRKRSPLQRSKVHGSQTKREEKGEASVETTPSFFFLSAVPDLPIPLFFFSLLTI